MLAAVPIGMCPMLAVGMPGASGYPWSKFDRDPEDTGTTSIAVAQARAAQHTGEEAGRIAQ